MTRILVIDDDPHIQRTLELMLTGDGHEVATAASGEEALELLARRTAELALVDLQLPGMGGVELLRALRDRHRDIDAIIITAHGSIETAVQSIQEGAFDYLTKPFSPDQVRHRIKQLERVRALRGEVAALQRRLGELPEHDLITQNPAMLHLIEVARGIAPTNTTVLITGESGTGKSLVARLVHGASRRRDGPFVTLDCTSLHASLLESELFGHTRGSFTGAVADQPGKVEAADGGTLFLDEVGEIPLPLQSKLLRFVEQRSFERVGDTQERRVDARIVAATNRDLEEMVADKSFRQDLFFRLSVVDLSLPPLRRRPDDLALLAGTFLSRFSRAHGRQVTDWDPDVERLLIAYAWPGNVRELANVIERGVLMAAGRTLRAEHLPARLRDPAGKGEQLAIPTLAQLEESHIRKVLALGRPLDEAARLLGVDPSTLWRKRKRYGI